LDHPFLAQAIQGMSLDLHSVVAGSIFITYQPLLLYIRTC
jgi:hypothetical protein